MNVWPSQRNAIGANAGAPPDPPTMASLQRQLEELLVQVAESRQLQEQALASIEDTRRVVRGIAGMRS